MTRRWPDISKPRGDTGVGAAVTAGLGMLAGVIVLVIVGLILATLFSVRPARAHEAHKGWSYPWECCANNDCTQISADRVKTAPGGYLVDGRFHVAQKDVRVSPDGEYHACFPKPDVLKCFWAPPPGS